MVLMCPPWWVGPESFCTSSCNQGRRTASWRRSGLSFCLCGLWCCITAYSGSHMHHLYLIFMCVHMMGMFYVCSYVKFERCINETLGICGKKMAHSGLLSHTLAHISYLCDFLRVLYSGQKVHIPSYLCVTMLWNFLLVCKYLTFPSLCCFLNWMKSQMFFLLCKNSEAHSCRLLWNVCVIVSILLSSKYGEIKRLEIPNQTII